MSLKAVLFDLGGTLVEMRPGHTAEEVLARAAPAALRLLRPDQAASVDPEAFGLAVRRAFLELEDAACAGDLRPVPAELVMVRGLGSLGITADPGTARAMLDALATSEAQTNQLVPGALEALQALVAKDLRLGVISNRMYGGTVLRQDLGALGIGHLFSTVVASCDVGQMKPHPLIFSLALQNLGVMPADAVMVGDDLRADIAGALAAGMRAVWVQRPTHRTGQPPTDVPSILHLDELPAIIELIGARR